MMELDTNSKIANIAQGYPVVISNSIILLRSTQKGGSSARGRKRKKKKGEEEFALEKAGIYIGSESLLSTSSDPLLPTPEHAVDAGLLAGERALAATVGAGSECGSPNVRLAWGAYQRLARDLVCTMSYNFLLIKCIALDDTR